MCEAIKISQSANEKHKCAGGSKDGFSTGSRPEAEMKAMGLGDVA